jgi:acyl-coenzyme A thioesterase PaaI-like protein
MKVSLIMRRHQRTLVDELNAVLEGTPFLKPYGFSVQSCSEGECVLHVAFVPALERPGGIVSGMTLMGAADVAMWLAIMTKRGTEERWVTSDMKTAFLRSGRQEDFLCTARLLKIGTRSAYGTAECNGAASGLLAHHVLTYVRVAD